MKKRHGQFLVELLVALGILTTGFMAILGLLSRSLGLSRVVAEDYVATYLASEGIEVAKNILDANALQNLAWNDGFDDGAYEVSYESTGMTYDLASNPARNLLFDGAHYGYTGGTAAPFRRRIEIALTSSDEIQVNSIVNWSSRGRSAQVNLEAHFFNWKP